MRTSRNRKQWDHKYEAGRKEAGTRGHGTNFEEEQKLRFPESNPPFITYAGYVDHLLKVLWECGRGQMVFSVEAIAEARRKVNGYKSTAGKSKVCILRVGVTLLFILCFVMYIKHWFDGILIFDKMIYCSGECGSLTRHGRNSKFSNVSPHLPTSPTLSSQNCCLTLRELRGRGMHRMVSDTSFWCLPLSLSL